jgi:hypothetical protein
MFWQFFVPLDFTYPDEGKTATFVVSIYLRVFTMRIKSDELLSVL